MRVLIAITNPWFLPMWAFAGFGLAGAIGIAILHVRITPTRQAFGGSRW